MPCALDSGYTFVQEYYMNYRRAKWWEVYRIQIIEMIEQVGKW